MAEGYFIFTQIQRIGAFALLIAPSFTFAALTTQIISPAETAAGIVQIHSGHVAGFDGAVPPNGFLLVSLSGTSGATQEFQSFDRLAASLGYHFLALDYPNNTTTVVCREHPSLDCFDLFHAAILEGHAGSPWVSVDQTNSVENRLLRALEKLALLDPAQWAPYIQRGAVKWDKVVLVGHSQGSGHVAYLSKLHPVRRLLILAGLQDAWPAPGPVAPWVDLPSATSAGEIYALLHQQDFFGYEQQVRALSVLLHSASATSSHSDQGDHSDHIYTTNHPELDPHNSLLTTTYADIWEKMLRLPESNLRSANRTGTANADP